MNYAIPGHMIQILRWANVYSISEILILKHLFQKACTLIFCDLSMWLPSCDKIGAPSGMDLNECLHINEGCDAYKHGRCSIDSSYLIGTIYAEKDQCQVIIYLPTFFFIKINQLYTY